MQFALFQPLQPQQVGGRGVLQGFDGSVEVAVFLLQAGEFSSKIALVIIVHEQLPGRFGTPQRSCSAYSNIARVEVPRKAKSQSHDSFLISIDCDGATTRLHRQFADVM